MTAWVFSRLCRARGHEWFSSRQRGTLRRLLVSVIVSVMLGCTSAVVRRPRYLPRRLLPAGRGSDPEGPSSDPLRTAAPNRFAARRREAAPVQVPLRTGCGAARPYDRRSSGGSRPARRGTRHGPSRPRGRRLGSREEPSSSRSRKRELCPGSSGHQAQTEDQANFA